MFKYLLVFFVSLSLNSASYTINLMWISKDINNDNQYVFPSKLQNTDNTITDVLDTILKWAQLNPDAKVLFWYDEHFCRPAQISETRTLFDKFNNDLRRSEFNAIKAVNLRDWIPEMDTFPIVFSANRPIYFRVDLLRLMVSLRQVKTASNRPFVSIYADLDVRPEAPDAMFKQKTVSTNNEEALTELLTGSGLVMKRKGTERFENSFHMLSTENQYTLKALEEAGIKASIKKVQDLYLNNDTTTFQNPEVIFNTALPLVYAYSNHLQYSGHVSLEKRQSDGSWIEVPREGDNSDIFKVINSLSGFSESILGTKDFRVHVPGQNGSTTIEDITFIERLIPGIDMKAPPIRGAYSDNPVVWRKPK